MATITTNTFLDGGTARTAGEAWTMNGGVLTIRTDTRWHANSPASMTGSIGATTTSATLGGGVLIDSTAVRWMPYNTGSGTVPAIGTTVTQGGVSGYLLGVWADYTSAPTAVGAAMPATGYLKFREVTGGTFSAGALTGVGASATAADRQGWIEIAQDQAVANTVPRLGFFRTRGGWFELDQTTSGSANQTIQIPTNGGGAGTHVPAVWIETGVGTNVYEMFPAVLSTWFLAANLGTDDRSKFVQTLGSGQVRIGYDGTANAGFVPPAGCRIRIPSNIGRQTSAANRALNLVPHGTLATRPDFTTTSAGDIDFEYMMNDWYHLFSAPYRVRMINCATFDIHSTANEASPTELTNYGAGAYLGTSITLTGLNNPLGGTITDCKFFRAAAASNGHAVSMTGCSNYTFVGTNEVGVIQYARSTGLCTFSQCRNYTQTGVFKTFAVPFVPTTSANFDFERIRYIDRLTGTTNATTGLYAIQTTVSSDNIIIRNIDFGGYTNVHPYLGVLNSSNCTNVTVRNGGTFASPIGGATNAPASIYVDSGNNDGMKLQNIYLTATRTSLHTTVNTSKNQTFERLGGTTGSTVITSVNTLNKGTRSASNSVTGQASVYGSHVFDMFESDTAGRVWWAMNEPTAFSTSFVTLSLAGASGGFTSGGQVAMPTLGDELIIDMPYYAIGHTAFDNSAPTLTGTNTGNFSYEYDLDVNDGNGFTGSYQTLNGANLSAETIDPVLGFKLRLKVTCTTAATTNALTYVRISTDSTALAQANTYPLDTANPTLELTGLTIGTEVVVFNDNYSTELAREVLTGTTFEYPYEWISDTGDFNVNILVWKDDKVPFISTITLGDIDQSIPLTQSEDLVYNASYTNAHTFDFANELILLLGGVYNVQEAYSLWKDEMLQANNAQYNFAFSQVGGNPAGGANSIPFYTFLSNGWKIRPEEVSGTTTVTGGILLTDDNSDPFVDTLGAYTVRINYQQPVQAIAVSTGGGGGATASEVWSFATRTLSSGGVSAIQSGLATSAEVAALPAPDNASIAAILEDTGTSGVVLANNSITSSVVANNALNNSSFTTGYFNSINSEVDTALADYDAATKAELDAAQSSIEADIAAVQVSADKALTVGKFLGLK